MAQNNVLIVELHHRFGGGQAHSLNMHKELLKNGYNSNILVPHGKEITKKTEEQQLPLIKTNILKLGFIKPVFQVLLLIKLCLLCKRHGISIIHCNKDSELWAAKVTGKLLGVKVVFTCHTTKPLKFKRIKNITAFVGVNPEVVDKVKKMNGESNLSIKVVEFIPPFFDEARFTNYENSQNRHDFFKENFSINLKKCPVICVIANLSVIKNQKVLLHAMATLIHDKGCPVQAIFAGVGSQLFFYQQLSNKLGISEYVHFIGFTDNTAGLLFNSDMVVIPSVRESFGIVQMEAALMCKPIISSFGSGQEQVIKHGKTGLLFSFDDYQVLAKHIDFLINNPAQAQKIAESAQVFVLQNLSNRAKFEKLDSVYKSI